MSPLAEKVLGMVVASGNVTNYRALHGAVEFEERRGLPNALKELKNAGVLTEVVKLVDGAVVVELTKV